jgi:uncharacterized protein YutD
MFKIEYQEKLDRETFERLFSEARPYVDHEVERIGGENILLEGMWKSHNVDPKFNKLRSRVYKIDDYVVGCSHFTLNYYNDYMWYSEVLLGKDQNGSKSWWYSEDMIQAERKFLADRHQSGFISALNPEGPIGKVAGERYTKNFNGKKYFSGYSWEGLAEIIPEMTQIVSPNLFQVLKVNL